jgi:hypothetical protein
MGFRAQRLVVTDAEHFGDSQKFANDLVPFFHDVTAVNLYRNFSDANLRCYLLVHEPGGNRVQLRPSPFCQQEMLDATRARIPARSGL